VKKNCCKKQGNQQGPVFCNQLKQPTKMDTGISWLAINPGANLARVVIIFVGKLFFS
jgi:hypothetical protein